MQNGIALSGTVHWLFDRHLITITDDHRLVVARSKVPATFGTVYDRHGTVLHVPNLEANKPHRSYLAKHRAKFEFKNAC